MKTEDFFYCRNCIYLSRTNGEHTCDYIGVTGHMRGCKAGVGCTKRYTGRKTRRKMPTLFPPDSQRRD